MKVMVASIQMTSTTNTKENLLVAENLIQQSSKQGAKIVVLPEFFILIDNIKLNKLTIAEKYGDGVIQTKLSNLARQNKIWLFAGSIPIISNEKDKIYNSMLVYNPDGDCVSRYDKCNLFKLKTDKLVIDESLVMTAGTKPVVCNTEYGKIGMAICYDLRFPSFLEQMGDINLLVVPAAFSYLTGEAHWELLTRTRALDLQCFVIASAQYGHHQSGMQTWGNSIIIDPWGRVLARKKEGIGCILAELDLEEIDSYRQSLPVLQARKDYKYQS